MDIPGLLREANFIPETRNIDTLFKEMQSRKIHMEIVVDEYGQTAGLLTMEDILEEIVGNIMDEYDEEEDFIQAMEDGTFVMSGLTPLEDVMETLDIELPEEDSDTYDTLNGYLVSRLDRIPQEGENPQVEFGGWLFEVERAGNKMIESVRVCLCQKAGRLRTAGKIRWKRNMMQLIESTKEMFRDSRFLRKALMIACPVALQGMLNTVVNLVDT